MMNAAERMIIPINCSCDRIEPFFRDTGSWSLSSMPMAAPLRHSRVDVIPTLTPFF